MMKLNVDAVVEVKLNSFVVYVSVTDVHGAPISSLKQSNIQILDMLSGDDFSNPGFAKKFIVGAHGFYA